jgi:inositol transport system substrate-binding protein
MRLRTTLLSATSLAAVGALGTGAQAATICFSFQDLETEFWVAGHQAITTTLTEAGHTVIERNAQEDANRQLEQINDCIAQGVDGIIIIPQDGDSAATIVQTAQDNDVPIAVFNRPPSTLEQGLIVVADNAAIARQAVDFVAQEAMEQITDRPIQSLIIVATWATPTRSVAGTASTRRSSLMATSSPPRSRSPRSGTRRRPSPTSRRRSRPTSRST